MRLVNEDNEELLQNHEESNRLLTASAEEAELHRIALNKRDEKRLPLSDELINFIQTKGRNATSITLAVLPYQTAIMLWKRFYQFTRSRGQWSMGVVIPFVLALFVGILLSTMPNDLLDNSNTPIYATYSDFNRTVIGGPNQITTEAYIENAFGDITMDYVGDSYVDVYDTIHKVANSAKNNPSVDGIYYDSLIN